MVRRLCMVVFFSCTTLQAQLSSQCAADLSAKDVVIDATKPHYLTGDVCARTLTIADGARIYTKGSALTIRVGNLLDITGTAFLQSYETILQPFPTPPSPSPAPSGATYDPGPNTSGPAAYENGVRGGDGMHGNLGVDANPIAGANCAQGDVLILVGTSAVLHGALVVDLRGRDGGNGGRGQDGGNGGNGEQGSRAQFSCGWFHICTCTRGPGHGGDGGNGGNAGNGGNGGCGQQGANLVLDTIDGSPFGGDIASFGIASIDLTGGLLGEPGAPGDAGTAGHAGYGGRGSTACSGEEQTRRGNDGIAGLIAAEGQCGAAGSAGTFTNNLHVSVNSDITKPASLFCRAVIPTKCISIRKPNTASPVARADCAYKKVLQVIWLQSHVFGSSGDYAMQTGITCDTMRISAPANDSEFLKLLRARLAADVITPPGPATSCSGFLYAANHLQCCLSGSNITATCLAGTPIIVDPYGLAKGMFFQGVTALLAAELASATKLEPFDTAMQKFPALGEGETYLDWGEVTASSSGGHIMTRLTPALLENLLAAVTTIYPQIERFSNSGSGNNAIECNANGLHPVRINPEETLTGKAAPIYVSTGAPPTFRPSPGPTGPPGYTIRVDLYRRRVILFPQFIAACQVNETCKDEYRNTCLREIMQQYADAQIDPFTCFGPDPHVVDSWRQFNDWQTGVVALQNMYLNGVMSSFGAN